MGPFITISSVKQRSLNQLQMLSNDYVCYWLQLLPGPLYNAVHTTTGLRSCLEELTASRVQVVSAILLRKMMGRDTKFGIFKEVLTDFFHWLPLKIKD